MRDRIDTDGPRNSHPRPPRTMRAIPLLSLLALLSLAPAATGQVLGQFTTAAVSAEGEGTAFMLAGNDAFRTGAAARFELTRAADLGVQLGLDRVCEESFFGGGLDVKLALLERSERLPLAIALDAGGGWLESDDHSRYSFDFGVLLSGAVGRTDAGPLEPFVTLAIDVERIDDTTEILDVPGDDCPCSWVDHETDTSFFARAGVMIPVPVVTTVPTGRGL